MKFCCALVALAFDLARAGGDGHEHHSCACQAEELGFLIDCSDNNAMLQAMAVLQDANNNCKTDCTSEICHKNYLIVQSHHDYCLHDEVPEPLEDGIHAFEEGCQDCEIVRKPDPNLPNCPAANCNQSGDEAYQALLMGGCLNDCNTDHCITNYRILRVVHDTCPEDTLDPLSESGIHDYEETCEAHNCNTQTPNDARVDMFQALICEDDRSAAAVAAWWFSAAVALMALALVAA